MHTPFSLSKDQLPDSLPILAVKDVFLLPAGKVSLNFTDPADIDLVQDVLRSPVRMVGVVLVKKQSAVGSAPEIYKVGCAGRITAFEETPSGAVIATITGYCRFDIEEELEGLRKYRTVKSNWTPYYDDLIIEVNPPLDRDRCAELLKKYAETLSIEMDWAVLNQVPNMSLINFFAMCLPFSRAQRQKLLEAQTLKDRGECLVKLLEDKLKAKKSRKKTD